MKHLLILILSLTPLSFFAQIDESRMFIFGHSLIDHRPPINPTPSNETTVPHWIYLLAKEAGKEYKAGGQYGFLPQHANLPPISQWGYDLVPGVWESDTEPFSAADINSVLITAGNFMQWQAPDLEYPGDPGVTPISATIEIADWVVNQENDVRFYIYENWPDMAGYLNNGFPPTPGEFAAYNNYIYNDFHNWWVEYHDAVLAQRPGLEVKMIPVGPILAKVFEDLLDRRIPAVNLYEDDAPHGRPTIYFLAALTTYMAVYSEKAPANFVIPDLVHSEVRNNYGSIIEFIWVELKNFNLPSGKSRVFFDDFSDLSIQNLSPIIKLYPNPAEDFINISGDFEEVKISVFDTFGNLIEVKTDINQGNNLGLQLLSKGVYFFKIEDSLTGKTNLQKVIKL